MLQVLPSKLHGLVIEVTEHELAAEDGALEEGLARLRARGARIAVDDAGAGYAGLNQVMRVQPDLIKLDRSLVEGVHNDSAKAALIEFFVLFARRVGAGVCTEGIETLDELRALVNLGVGLRPGLPARATLDALGPDLARDRPGARDGRAAKPHPAGRAPSLPPPPRVRRPPRRRSPARPSTGASTATRSATDRAPGTRASGLSAWAKDRSRG